MSGRVLSVPQRLRTLAAVCGDRVVLRVSPQEARTIADALDAAQAFAARRADFEAGLAELRRRASVHRAQQQAAADAAEARMRFWLWAVCWASAAAVSVSIWAAVLRAL